MFVAFLISNFMAPVSVWLGIEYIKLAGRFEAAGTKNESPSLSSTAKLFKILAIFCFCNVAVYIINLAVLSPQLSASMMDISAHPSDPALFTKLTSLLSMVITIVIISMSVTIASSRIARAAWERILANLAGEPSPTTSTSGSFQVSRVIKGATQAFQAGIMIAIVMALLGVLFSLLASGLPAIPPVVMVILAIPAIILGIAGLISSLAGMVNQAVGLFDLGRNMGLDGSIEHRILLSDGAVRGASIPSIRRNVCPQCKEPCPDDPGVKFCPSCGNPL